MVAKRHACRNVSTLEPTDVPNELATSLAPTPTTTAKPKLSSTGKDKKDDVVIYYYYYYDDDKNKTDNSLDAIPSLEGFDNLPVSKPKPGKVIIKNPNESKPKEQSPLSKFLKSSHLIDILASDFDNFGIRFSINFTIANSAK